MAYGILVPPPGIEPGPSAVKALSPNHGTTRGFPNSLRFFSVGVTGLVSGAGHPISPIDGPRDSGKID